MKYSQRQVITSEFTSSVKGRKAQNGRINLLPINECRVVEVGDVRKEEQGKDTSLATFFHTPSFVTQSPTFRWASSNLSI
jgi:hypothetical protein